MERGVTFLTRLVVFGQSQCTVPAGQSEQTVLVGSSFVENEAFERGVATINVQYLRNNVFFTIKRQRIQLHQIHKIMIFKRASDDPFNVFKTVMLKDQIQYTPY